MENKIGFFGAVKNMFVGICKPAQYIENGKRSSWFTANILILIVSILLPLFTFLIPVMSKYGNNKVADKVSEMIPYFSISSDGFYCDERYEYRKLEGNYFLIDTSISTMGTDFMEDLMEDNHYTAMVIVCSQETYLYSDGKVKVYPWRGVYDYLHSLAARNSYDKSIIISLLEKYDTPVICAAYCLLVLGTLIMYYIICMILAVPASIIAGHSKIDADFSEMMKACIYIRTIWYILAKTLKCLVWSGLYILVDIHATVNVCAFGVMIVYVCVACSAYAKKHPRVNNYAAYQDNTGAATPVPNEEFYGD